MTSLRHYYSRRSSISQRLHRAGVLVFFSFGFWQWGIPFGRTQRWWSWHGHWVTGMVGGSAGLTVVLILMSEAVYDGWPRRGEWWRPRLR